jgi:hypothetical protein
MDSRFQKNLARTAGAILGVGLALTLILASRPGASASPLPATLRVSIMPAGELEVTPASPEPVLVADSLLPGDGPTDGEFQVRNQTGSTLAIGLRSSADSTALDGLARIRLTDGGRSLADTTLQGMKLRPAVLRLASGARVRLRLEAWIPRDVLSGYEGRLVNVSMVTTVRAVGGRG